MEVADQKLREAASRMARRLVLIVEPVLYGWEVSDAEEEFAVIVLEGLREINDERASGSGGSRREPRA